MLALILVFASFQACFAGRLQIILPNGHELDPSSSSFNSQSLLEFNKHVLGIGSSANASQKVSGGDLFDRPKALIVVSIVGSDDFNYNGHVFDFNDNFESQQILNDLKLYFGDEMIHADVNSSGIFGSPHFKRNTLEIEPDRDNQDILNMDKLARAIREKDRTSSNVVDYYRIHLDISNARSHDEKMKLEENIKLGIENIEQAINNTENKDVLIELFSHVKPTKEKDRMKAIRKQFNVVQPRYHDYQARFSIAALVTFGFIFAVVAMVWFMIDESEMSKNSLVYRLSPARPKKD
ncbi:unnamed protein product [Caenorhabditis brenneri]